MKKGAWQEGDRIMVAVKVNGRMLTENGCWVNVRHAVVTGYNRRKQLPVVRLLSGVFWVPVRSDAKRNAIPEDAVLVGHDTAATRGVRGLFARLLRA